MIPALFLFLSNIPFVHKMDMKEAMVMMKKSGCCKKKSQMRGCHMNDNKKPCDPKQGKCGKPDASCVCICSFQYIAPDQVSIKLQFGIKPDNNERAGYLLQPWKDPQLLAPWQPPDLTA
jgi:hypothetical protein